MMSNRLQKDENHSRAIRFLRSPEEATLPAETFTTKSSNSSHQLHVSWEHGDALRIDRNQIGILEQIDQVSLRRFL